jgi:hypothetical protein
VGVPLEQRGRYLDVLADYSDADDLRRLNGAEKSDYVAAGLPPPPNDFPRSRDELRRMLGWQDLIASIEARLGPAAAERFISLFTASRLPGVNLNSAPAPVLSAVTGIVPARVGALLDQRQLKPFISLAELAPYTQGPISADSAMLIPGASWRVSHVKKGLPFLLECRVILTPMARDRPARVSECQRRAAASIDATWDKRFISVADPTQRQLSRSIENTANASQRTMDRAAESATRDQTATNENQRNANIQPLDWLSRYLDNAERSPEGANRGGGARN